MIHFTIDGYKQLVNAIQSEGYAFSDYHNYIQREKPCIMRHDVDMDMGQAEKLAQLEADLGVKSTYFVLLNTDFYNLFSSENTRRLKRIISLGHTVGLHFDEVQYNITDDDELIDKILTERKALSAITDTQINCVSMHRPSKDLLAKNLEIPGMVNSYSPVFFNEFKYISDSRMHWREDPFERAQSGLYPKLHMLTHPIWYAQKECVLGERLKEWILQASKTRYDLLNSNFRDLENEVRRDEI